MGICAAAWRVSSAADAASGPGAAALAVDPNPDQAAGPPSGAEYVWVAATGPSLPAMAPGATEEIALQVRVARCTWFWLAPCGALHCVALRLCLACCYRLP